MRRIIRSSLFQHLFCTCRIQCGPAGDYLHHDSNCLITKLGKWRSIAANDPRTNWWTV